MALLKLFLRRVIACSDQRKHFFSRGMATVRYRKRGDPAEVLRCNILEHVLQSTVQYCRVCRACLTVVACIVGVPGFVCFSRALSMDCVGSSFHVSVDRSSGLFAEYSVLVRHLRPAII